ncbi:MAG: SEL1-like repeat protein [Planctomycetota bacterium]|jgi:TPR repeat protein|nr:SEL1-like repeat protein [Planctomycetota bacterium]
MSKLAMKLIALAEQGDATAQCNLALHYINPKEGEIDAGKAFIWFAKAAEQGLSDAQYYLADFYENIKRDLPNAIKWYHAAANQGHARAQSTLGYCYERGHGVVEDSAEAVKWHKLAAEQGYAVAQSNLARCYEQGRGIDRNLSEAIKWYEASAERGYHLPGVFNDLGLFYLTGNGVEVDTQRAVYWLSKGVEQNEPPAFANLGRCYLCGIGVEQDVPVALDLFAKAIRYGIDDAENFLYENINIVELLMLANTENSQAQYFAAKWYRRRGDDQKAIELLTKSSEQEEPLAMILLGGILAEGSLVKRDLFKSEKLLVKASEFGVQKAAEFLNEIREIIAFHAPYYLVKVTAKEFAEKLLDGEIFMRSISWFMPFMRWSRDQSQPYVVKPSIDDFMEGYVKSLGGKPNPYGHWINEAGEPIDDGFRKSGLIDMLLLREKIFCLFSLEYNEATGNFVTPDSQMRYFGDNAVVITDPAEFLRRVRTTIEARFSGIDYYLACRRVAYDVDINSADAYNEFHKTKGYADQKEFRIAFDLSEGRFDRKTLDGVSDWLVLEHLTSLGKIGDEQHPATVPLTAEEMKKYKARDFRGMIEVNENPDYVNDTLTLNIGDIRDIAVALPIEQFLEIKGADLFTDKGFKPPLPVAPYVPKRKRYPTFFTEIACLTEKEKNNMLWREKWRKDRIID